MADVIQFHCPACGATLRLPLEMAARQGPCPCCNSEIVAPDPYHGTGARMATPPRVVEAEVPIRAFVDSPPVVPRTPVAGIPTPQDPPNPQDHTPIQSTRPEPQPPVHPEPSIPVPPPEVRACAGPQRAILVLSVLLTAALSLAAGYLLGVRSNWLVSKAPFPVWSPPKLETPPTPAASTVQTVLIKPPAPPEEAVPAPGKKPEITKASTVAETALKAFLDAPDWTTRSAYVLSPEKVRAAMEAYSHNAPDGPTPYQSISVQNSYTDKKTGNTLFIFQVVTETHPTGIPVAVSETSTGWQVDWQSFVEFRDDLFKSFADGPTDQSGRFHLIVSAPPAARAANTENEHFSSFLLDPPLPGRQRIAYVKKPSEIHSTLAATTANGAAFTPFLEVAKRNTPDGRSYLEIVRILANDWLPE